MGRQLTVLQNGHRIVATAVGLVVFVSLALGWLGWSLLEQEEVSRNRQLADAVLTGFHRRIEEKKEWLSRFSSALPSDAGLEQPGDGGILVSFSDSGLLVQPADQLVYYPALPQAPTLDAAVFERATNLEFVQTDWNAAAAVLSTLAESKNALVRAEALLRLARVQKRNGETSEALSTYAKLQDETRMGPSEEPYGVSSRIARFELLAALQENAKAQQEASVLLTGLEAGRWPIAKETFAALYPKIREAAGLPAMSNSLDAKLAIAEAVEAAWDEWQLFQMNGTRSVFPKVWQKSERMAVLGITHANANRMVSVIYAGDAIRNLGLQDATLTDEGGRTILGRPLEPTVSEFKQSLSVAGLPWQLHVTSSTNESIKTFSKERRNYLVFTLVVIVVLVSLACYAMSRGVLREQAAGRLQSDFVSAVSHEFRSPLTTLRQLTELLAEGRIHEEGRSQKYFTVLQQETARLNQLVEDLLDFGRIDAGRRQYELQRVEFAEVVRDGIGDYENHAGANGHSIELDSSQRPLLVKADREAMRRVVRNLLENAVKYSPQATTVWVDTGQDGPEAFLRVRDAGIGVPPGERSRIFEKFFRGEAAKTACIPGTGIGLAMVKEIVRVHRGKVDLSSEVGHGSTFIVRLPLDGGS